MPGNVINTVFPVIQGFDSVPRKLPPNPQPSEVFPLGVEGQELAPGVGVATEVKASNIVTRP